MDVNLLELHFAQLAKAWSKSKFNNYSDKRKQAYKEKLASLFKALQEDDFSILDEAKIKRRTSVIDFFFKSLEFLDNSTLNLIPFEIVECLEVALREWIDHEKDYIVVTSLVNNPSGFSFDQTLAVNNLLYEAVKEIYSLEFDRKLIQINLPRFLVRDYLANVVLYHELGHFIDVKYNISQTIYKNLCNRYFTNSLTVIEKADVEYFFPYISSLGHLFASNQLPPIILFHIMEYFADVFASQYIGDCSNHYLNYITKKQSYPGPRHPATTHRVEFVNNFLSNKTDSFTLNLIKDATKQITKREISIRNKEVISDDFINLVPCSLANEQQLHSLFILGWKTWLDDWEKISVANDMKFVISSHQVYTIINNLIEKSINSFIVTKSWEANNANTEGPTT